jgi:hypothetical protein
MKVALQRWLLWVAALHVIGGLATPFIAYSSLFDGYTAQLQTTFWTGVIMPVEALAYQRWMVALFGPTVAAWGVLMWFLVKEGIRSNKAWPWNAILGSLLAWAPADIGISLLHDFWPHVYLDIVVLLALGVPALVLRAGATRAVNTEL